MVEHGAATDDPPAQNQKNTHNPRRQGCCLSRPSGADSPYPESTTPTSSHAINEAPTPTSNPPSPSPAASATIITTTPGGPPHHRRRRAPQQPLDQHINKPLRAHAWTSKTTRWTRAALDRERADFFDTRVSGRPEVWQALHAALQVLWDPPSAQEDDGAQGLATAQSILDAAEITLPTGRLRDGAYDDLGNYYAFHEWIVSDPENMVEEDEEGERGDGVAVDDEDAKTVGPFGGEAEEEDVVRRREEKGKAVVDVRDLVVVYARLSENGRDIKLSVAKDESVRSVARRVLEESGVRNFPPLSLSVSLSIASHHANSGNSSRGRTGA